MRLLVSTALVVALAALAGAPARADVEPPLIESLTPATGPATGGTTVTISGAHFGGTTAVTFGGQGAESFSVGATDTTITAVAPPGSGTVDVLVTTGSGRSSPGSNARFTYAPAISSLDPAQGSVSGDTQVTIRGGGFTGATAVRFGGTDATQFTVVSDSEIDAVAPEGGGVVPVTVVAPAGTSAGASYTYQLAVTAADPGPGGNQVTLTGIGFAVATHVTVGDSYAGFVVPSDTQLVVQVPSGTSPDAIVVETPYGSTKGISGSVPSSGPTVGATGKTPGSSGFPSGSTSGGVTVSTGGVRPRLAGIPTVVPQRRVVTVAGALTAATTLRIQLLNVHGRVLRGVTRRQPGSGAFSVRLLAPRGNARYRVRVAVPGQTWLSRPFTAG